MYPPSRDVNFRPPYISQQDYYDSQISQYNSQESNPNQPPNFKESYTPVSHGVSHHKEHVDLVQIGQTLIGDDTKDTKESKNKDYEMLSDNPIQTEEEKIKEIIAGIKVTINPVVLFLLLIVGSIVFGLWYDSINIFIREKFHGGADLSMKQVTMWAIIFSALFVLLLHLFGVSLIYLE